MGPDPRVSGLVDADPGVLLDRVVDLIPPESLLRSLFVGNAAEGDGGHEDEGEGEGGDGTALYLWPITKDFISVLDGILPKNTGTILDIGCGRGLAGVAAALLRPEAHVILSDGNAVLCDCLACWDWGPLAGRVRVIRHPWDGTWPYQGADVIIGSDLTYRDLWLDELFGTMAAALNPTGTFHLAEKWSDPVAEVRPFTQTKHFRLEAIDHGTFRQLTGIKIDSSPLA